MKRIKYASRYAKALTSKDIEALAEQAAAKNKELGITGVLMTADGLFFQIIEGPDQMIDAVYQDICNDSRHDHILLMAADDNIESRLFPDWSMKRFDLDKKTKRTEPLKAILSTVIRQRMIIDDLTKVLERAIWTEFAQADKS